MKINKSIIYSLLVLLGLNSCSDDFLASAPKNGSTEDLFYKTDAQLYSALMGAYDPLQWSDGLYGIVPIGEIRSDNAKTGGGGDGDNPAMQSLENFTNTEVNELSDKVWKRSYYGIYRANLVINTTLETEATKIYKAEALFIRAWQHFNVLRTFGPCPIITETLFAEDYKFTRDTREAVNKAIEADLLAAIPNLSTEFDDTQTGRITKSAAQALLGKVYIYWADWNNDDKALFDKAVPYLEEVINSGQYQLFTDYSKLFAANAENNSESIFEIQRSTKSGWTNWGNSNGSEGNFWAQFCGPRSFNGNHPTIEGGWGFLLPQQELFDYFLPDDNIRRDAVVFTYEELVTEPNKTLPADKQVEWKLDSYNINDFDGFAQKKYALWKAYDFTGAKPLNRPGNERMIRYGEVYLLLAEAKLRGNGSEAEAKALIDELRKYHVAMGEDTFDGVDDLITKYPTRFPTTLDVLWYERRCELAGEGDRWYDLVRSGRAKDVMSAIYPGQWKDKHVYIPIGSIEIGNSGGSLTAYPTE